MDAAKKARVRELFPEVEDIQDKALADQVVNLWVRSWELSDWADLTDVPKNDRLSEVSLVTHVRGVTQAARAMAKVAVELYDRVEVDMDILTAGALLHDMSKPIETSVKGKTEASQHFPHAYLAAHMAQEAGLSDRIVHIILSHSPNTSPMLPKTQEALIVHYADYADSDVLNIRYGQKILLKFH